MNAREQSREAAWEAQSGRGIYDADIDGAADAVSDVWEPLVRRLYADLFLARRYVTDLNAQAEIGETLHQAKEALG